MMDFDSILDEWENRRDRGNLQRGRALEDDATAKPPAHPSVSDRPGQSMESDWVDRYLPGADIVEAKAAEEVPPVSEGRSIWLRRPHQDSLDLHGLFGREAREEIARFIRSMRRRGLRKGLIIHGKGLHSPDGSVLAPLVREYLEMSAEIGDFGRASRKDGGSGATWFLLRQRSR